MPWIETVLYIFGGLGVFIFGMKTMSESLEKAAGNNLKKLLTTATSFRVFGVITGFLITALIQSSSATTVMVVSFSNAGLLTLSRAVSIIMGANIGTTVTGWIVNVTKLKVDITLIAYVAVFVGMIMHFLRSSKVKTWGSFLIGFSLLFIGLFLLKQAIGKESILANSEFTEWLRNLPSDKFYTLLLFVLIGTGFTIILQSSSATMAITIIFLNSNYIDIRLAAAMVLGENIGTTITAILASLAGNRLSKKTATAHTIFNLIGVSWMLIPFVFNTFVMLCSKISNYLPDFIFGDSIEGTKLALFHTFFNITNTLLFIGFIPFFVRFINFIFGKEPVEEGTQEPLSNISAGIIGTPDFALLEAQNEVTKMANHTYKTFTSTLSLFKDSKKKCYQTCTTITNDEKAIDFYENEIYSFLVTLLKEDISEYTTDKINILLEQIRHFEWIGDICFKVATVIKKLHEDHKGPDILNELEYFNKLIDNLTKFYEHIIANLHNFSDDKLVAAGNALEKEINTCYSKIKKKLISQMGKSKKVNKKNVQAGLLLLDIIKSLEHAGDALKFIMRAEAQAE